MLTIRSLALLAAATVVAGQTIDSLGECATKCYNDVKARAGQWSCPADDMTCLCAVGDFKNGVHDCAAQCPGGVDFAGTVLGALNAQCATAVPAAPAPEPTTAAPSTPTVPIVVTSTPVTDNGDAFATAPASSSPTSETLAAASTSTSSSTLETSTTPATTGAAPTSTSSEEAAANPTASTTTSTTSTSETETTSSPESTQSSEPAGLTVAAKAGVGIGAGAAAVALLGFGGWFLARQRRNKRANGFSSKHMIKISDPAPGGGRSFAGDHHYETGLSELEMKSRRYEDMIPRQQPRHMV